MDTSPPAVRVAVFGAGGRMGSTTCRAVAADPDLELVAAVDPLHAGLDLRQVTGVDQPIELLPGPESLKDMDVDVAVDFTRVEAARSNMAWLAANGVHAVIGTSGVSDDDLA